MPCDRCAGERFTKAGRDRSRRQLYRCSECGRRLTARSTSAFRCYQFPDAVIALAVRWYLRFRLSYAEVAEWLAERGVMVDPSTIYDWVQACTPRFSDAARRHRSPVGTRWRLDETLLKINGRWRYVFRCLDEHGQIVDVYLSDHRLPRPLALSSSAPSRHATWRRPASPVTRRNATRQRCGLCCPRPNTAAPSTGTSGWNATTSSSRGGCGRCAASRRRPRRTRSAEALP
jgi:hypothetical protein